MADLDDDVIPSGGDDEPKYPWFQRPAPSVYVTFGLTFFSFVLASWMYASRVASLRAKFGLHFKGSLRACALISAYMDNYGFSRLATLKLCTKSFLFLAFLQLNFHRGFWIMWGILILESSLDTIRVLLAYRNCASLAQVEAITEEEAKDIRAITTLNPTNVYEDLTRPQSIAIMVFVIQTLFIGLVMYDTYETETRTCFNGRDGCPMFGSLGSYCLYLLGTFMASVFYIGPGNAYGQKEQNSTFWLKLFLMSKEKGSVLSWTDPITEETHVLALRQSDGRIWLRFILSSIVNGIGFHFLLFNLPVQVAGQASVMGVVFRAVGMIYLADLDDAPGNTLTLVSAGDAASQTQNGTTYGSHSIELDATQQQIVDKAVADVKSQIEALLANGNGAATTSKRAHRKFDNVSDALLLSTSLAKRKKNDEESPLMV